LSAAEFRNLYDFYMARRGAFESFYFYTIDADTFNEPLYVGMGDGMASTFDLPGKSTSAQSIYLDGVLQSSGFNILTGGGDGSSDRVHFTTAPAAGLVIVCTFSGFMRIRCRFQDDKLTKERFSVALYKTGLSLKGLPPI
jgi:hypothetical protein